MALTPASILADYSSGIGTQGATLKVDANNERVGIGTTNPQGTLQVGTGVTVYGNTGIVSATNVKANTANFSGNVSVGGVLTYEDVTNVDSVGIITARAGVLVPDGQKIQLGTGDDLQIYHDATDSVIDNTTGDLYLKTTGSGDDIIIRAADDVLIQTQASEGAVIARGDGQVELYYNNSKKLETTNTGTVVTGILTATTFSGNLTGNLEGTSSIAAISSSITDTAVDVFVYDTHKDSDGGAWRKRTQHTSWYNETLNTSTRGSRKEFPAVAVIVATAASSRRRLIIYDGDDPNLSMWMIVDSTDGQWHQTETASPVYALNGIIALGSSSDSQSAYATRNRLDLFHFISDKIEGSSSSATYNGVIEGISNRSDVAVQYKHIGDNPYALVSYRVKDLAMTVLPTAPIDQATGLPVPTIAVGTLNVLSVITDKGTVVDYSGFAPTQKVAIDNAYVYASTRSGPNDYIFKSPFLSADASHSANIIAGSGGFTSGSTSAFSPQMKNMTVTDITVKDDHTVIRSGTDGIEIFDGNVDTITHLSSKIPIAYITSTYNTGYMVGNIKGAFLSDTNATNAAELVTNGTFDSDASNWNSGDTSHVTLSQSGGVLQVVISSGNDGSRYAYQQINNVPAGTYRVTATAVSNPSNRALLRVGTSDQASSGGGNATNIFNSGYLSGSNQTSTHLFTTTETSNIIITLFNDFSSGTGTWDNVKLHLAEEDRSVSNNPLQVYGTITKSAVATGAELVSYGPFSSSNYLIQPYNADLAPGTSEYSVICWFKTGTSTADQYIFDRTGDNAPRNLILIRASNSGSPNRIQFYHNDASNNNSDLIATDFIVTDNVWHQVVGLYDGSTYRVYIDGVASAVTNSTTRNVDNTDSPTLYVGIRNSLTAPITGQLALFRYSLSAPSAEQVKKMYEDEKFLFQENAKATIYGSSDSVTALAFDDDTNLLHVGTSGGRSDFQGLRRINNTTTAVTTAISASNDLVAEQ